MDETSITTKTKKGMEKNMENKKERLQALADYLGEDQERAEKLLKLDAEKASEELKKEGLTFTAEELVEFANEVREVAKEKQGELGENDLENVNGGFLGACLVVGGISLGVQIIGTIGVCCFWH